MNEVLRRELRVAFSKRVQPVWVRIVKWVVLISVAMYLHGTPGFWWWVTSVPILGLCVHFFFRWKTHGWTRPWGGWNDVEKGKS